MKLFHAYIDGRYAKVGIPSKILSENGTEFKNQLFTNVATHLGVEHVIYSHPYHHQSNRRIEGSKHFLGACVSKNYQNILNGTK